MPYQYNFLDGERHHTYLYKANYNEYRPRKLEWFEGILLRPSPPPTPTNPPTTRAATPDPCPSIAQAKRTPTSTRRSCPTPSSITTSRR